MVKYSKKHRKSFRRKLRKTIRRVKRGGYSPIGENGGNQGHPIKTYPNEMEAWKLPNPMAAAGVPMGKQVY
ncbi:hypothetical protein EB118_13350 [bacterium]|jgi:hypothetical protein|nr:hypothetical protein [Actinomycetota bacterium]NDG31038.1 hypothetical protein [bacterium]